MVKVKAGGIIIGGFAAYLLVSKGMNLISNAVHNICTARQWSNYYKYGKEGNMVPPGYSMHTHENEKGDTVEVNNGKQPVKQPQEAGKTSTGEALGRAVGDVIARMINDTFGGTEAVKGASEGQTEASESTNECPQDCDNCQVEKCPHEHLKNGGKLTKWDANGRPIGGCYPWSEGEELHWWVDCVGGAHSVVEDVGDTGATQVTDDSVVQIPANRNGDVDGDSPDIVRLNSDPDIIKMAQEAIEKNNSVIDKPKED